jgi:DNA repair protein RadC
MANYILKTFRCQLVCDGTSEFPHKKAANFNDARDIFFQKMANLPGEEIHALYVNGQNQITGHEMIAKGGMHGCAVTSKDVLRGAIAANAAAFLIAHNHPSGDPTPSREDIEMTRNLIKAGKVVGVALLDHIVVCPEAGLASSVMEKL